MQETQRVGGWLCVEGGQRDRPSRRPKRDQIGDCNLCLRRQTRRMSRPRNCNKGDVVADSRDGIEHPCESSRLFGRAIGDACSEVTVGSAPNATNQLPVAAVGAANIDASRPGVVRSMSRPDGASGQAFVPSAI